MVVRVQGAHVETRDLSAHGNLCRMISPCPHAPDVAILDVDMTAAPGTVVRLLYLAVLVVPLVFLALRMSSSVMVVGATFEVLNLGGLLKDSVGLLGPGVFGVSRPEASWGSTERRVWECGSLRRVWDVVQRCFLTGGPGRGLVLNLRGMGGVWWHLHCWGCRVCPAPRCRRLPCPRYIRLRRNPCFQRLPLCIGRDQAA